MYLRETRRTNRGGSLVAYLQLAHNERHPDSGTLVAKVIHSFGRAVKELVTAISRFINGWNERCHPFIWNKTADQILPHARRQRTSDAGH